MISLSLLLMLESGNIKKEIIFMSSDTIIALKSQINVNEEKTFSEI